MGVISDVDLKDPMHTEPTKAADHHKLAETANSNVVLSDEKALENQAELKRLIEETCKSISSSQDLIQQIKKDRGV